MNISALENLNQTAAAGKTPSPAILRKTAEQFEAILLMQLTSAMNGTGEADEDALFGSDGGSDLAKKMFSEQLATTMSQSGGVGLADMIMRQFEANQPNPAASGKIKSLSNAIAAVKDIKETGELKNLRAENNAAPLINKSVKFAPVKREVFTGNPNEFQVVSTYSADADNQNERGNFMPLLPEDKIPGGVSSPTAVNPTFAENVLVPADSKDSLPRTGEKAILQMPVNGRISSGFGTRFHPIDRKMKFHGGMDIAVPKGTPVSAAADGIVKFAGRQGGYGNLVIVEHADGTETRYGHNEKLLVKEGDFVSAGQQVSLSGSTGKSTGPHLHFEVRENGHTVDPQKYLSNVLPKNADR